MLARAFKTYVAFLRGINVGGNAIIKMSHLKESFESLRFENVRPVLASGNVVFQTPQQDASVLRKRIETSLKKEFGISVVVILRTASQILDLIKSDPFKGTKSGQETRLHITFLAEERNSGRQPTKLKNPEFQISQVSSDTVCSVVEARPGVGTPELMKVLEKEFGKSITTRTWNTVKKIAGLMGQSGRP